MAKEGGNAARNHSRWFAGVDVGEANRRALHAIFPGATPRQLVPFFQHRTTARTVKAWMLGERFMPQWAIDIVDAHGAMVRAQAAAIPRGKGKAAGWRNLAGYQLNPAD